MGDQEEFNLSQLYRARAKDFRTRNEQELEVNRIIERVREIFRDNGEEFEEGDEKQLVAEPAEKPGFPYIIFMAAVIKDILDIPLELTIIGFIVTTILSCILSIILFIWVLGKLSGGWWKKRIIRWLWIRSIAIIILEFFPTAKIAPANTIFILMAHHREKKIVKLFNLALEELRNAGVLKYIA